LERFRTNGGKSNLDDQPTFSGIAGGNDASVQVHGALGNCQPHAEAASGSLA
jgi:hypothetical protein